MKFTYVPMVASIISLLIFIPTAYLFAIHWKMEIAGLAYAKAIQELIVFCIETIYVLCFLPQVKDAIQWPSREVFQELAEYFKLAIPAVIIFSLFWFCFELYVVIAGTFGPANQAAASIFMSFLYLHETKKESFAQGSCAQIGNLIGAMRANIA